jgi:hypothetical protein
VEPAIHRCPGIHEGLLPLRAGDASKGCAATQFRLQSFVKQMKRSSIQSKFRARNNAMARPRNLEKLSYADLAKMEQRIAQHIGVAFPLGLRSKKVGCVDNTNRGHAYYFYQVLGVP